MLSVKTLIDEPASPSPTHRKPPECPCSPRFGTEPWRTKRGNKGTTPKINLNNQTKKAHKMPKTYATIRHRHVNGRARSNVPDRRDKEMPSISPSLSWIERGSIWNCLDLWHPWLGVAVVVFRMRAHTGFGQSATTVEVQEPPLRGIKIRTSSLQPRYIHRSCHRHDFVPAAARNRRS